MLWLAYLVLTPVFYTVNSQQDQNYYIASSDNRQQPRFAAYQPNHYTAGQQTFSYFPQTNAGPFLPFRTAADTYQLDGGVNSNGGSRNSQKYQTAFVASQPAAVEVASDPRFDSLISSPGVAYGGGVATNEDYSETSYPDPVPDPQPSQRFNSVSQDRQPVQQSSYRTAGQIASRFPSVAISEVTRTQDNPSNPSVQQTHSFNVQHTAASNPSSSRFASASDELPLTQNHRWRTQQQAAASAQQDASTSFRARNLPYFTAASKPNSGVGSAEINTEDPFAKFKSRFAAKEQTFLVNAQHSAPNDNVETPPESDSNISLYITQDGFFPSAEKKKEPVASPSSKTKNNVTGSRFKTGGNIVPTTYAPSILIDNRIRSTTPTTTTEYAVDVITTIRPFTLPSRGRNKYNRPLNEVDTNKEAVGSTKRRRVNAVHVKTTPLAPTVSTNFDVVTMSQDHVFVSEDNFKGFVDSAVIDSTETSTTEDLKDVLEGANQASVPTTHAPVKKKVLLPVEPKVIKEVEHDETPTTTENVRKSVATTRSTDATSTSTSTEAWVVVASVMTSRSVSGARFIPSSAIKQDQIPVAADIKSIKDIKEIRSQANKAPDGERSSDSVTVSKSSAKINTTAKPSHSQSTESIIDKLDQVQSELSSGILNAFPSQEKPALDIPMISSTVRSSEATSTTESTPKETYSRRYVSPAKTTSKPKLDRNKSLSDNASPVDDHGDVVPTSWKPRGSTQSSRTSKSSEAAETTSSTTTTEKASRKEGKNKSSTGGYKYKGKYDDVSSFLPSGFKPDEERVSEEPSSSPPPPSPVQSKPNRTSTSSKFGKVKFDDVSAFLPPGYKMPAEDPDSSPQASTDDHTERSKSTKSVSSSEKIPETILNKAKPVDLSAFLPPGFKLEPSTESANNDATTEQSTESVTTKSAGSSSGTKVVFAGRPGGTKKPPTNQSSKNAGAEKPKSNIPAYQLPIIQKGWPKRDHTREFTGWSTAAPSTISIKELLMAAQAANATSTSTEESSTAPTTTTTTATTTTRRATTPGICTNDCELAGSIRLIGGVQWSPALLDHNTMEWKSLAKDVENELQKIFQSSEMLSKWYRKISIDAFSEGSVVVDYFIDLSELGKTVNTAEMRRFFHESLIQESITSGTFISSTNDSDYRQLKLGKYSIDPASTDFVVLPRNMPAVRMAEQETWLPQWAFAVIVIGLASLIFVIVFGITVIISRRTKAKKHPTALTEEMLNELNKSHMGGFENYGADDLYNMEDVWNEKPYKHKRSSFYHDSGAQDIYDSWRSNWEHPSQYGHSGYNGSLRSGYFRRRPDYDTNF